jgi:L-ascorbate metabolism protein UlaG (beta-lactamase superfamily)
MKLRKLLIIGLLLSSPKTFAYTNGDYAPVNTKNLWDVIKWKMNSKRGKWPNKINFTPFKKLPEIQKDIQITFVNHATFIIRSDKTTILTDPIWSDRCSPVSWAGPKRVHPPAVTLEALKKVDIVIISHNHYDHLDEKTLKDLDDMYSPVFIVPKGDKKLLEESFEIKSDIVEMDWWVDMKVRDIKLSMTPAVHFSGRGMFDRNESAWGGYYLTIKGKSIFFGGDTGYGSHFKDIVKRYHAPDISLLPIGAYEPRDFMKLVHINPEEAVMAHKDLKSKFSIGMHFGTFPLTDEAYDQPNKDLKSALKKHQVEDNDFSIPQIGQIYDF